MTNTLKIKRGVGVPDSLDSGELAIDTATGQLYSLVAGVITEINGDPKDEYSNLYLNKTDKQDVKEGSFVLKFSDDSDTLPFVGRLGYNSTVADPLALEGSFLYAGGREGILAIGRNGDLEMQGDNTIRGREHRGGKPLMYGFASISADVFLDPDGNSIEGANVKIAASAPTDLATEGDLWYSTSDKGLYCFDGQFWFEVTGRQLPPDTVLSVNGRVGSVVVSASDVGAVPASTMVAAFATLKEAITEEDTVEGLRSAVIDGIDAVISKLLSEVNHNE